MASKVIINACYHLFVCKMPKKRRKNEENRLFPKTRIQTSLDKSPWESTWVLQYSYVSVISRFPLKTVHSFRKFLAVLPPPTLCKVETRKKILDIRVQHCLWGEGGGGWTCVDWKTPPEMQKCPKTFVHDFRQAKILMTIGQHVKTFSSPQLMIAFQNTGKRSDSQHHG